MRDTYKHYYNTILDAIDNDGYNDQQLLTEREKLEFLLDTYRSEYGWYEERYNVNIFNAIKEWLQGLPTACSLPYTYCDIIALAKQAGTYKETNEDKILNNYWAFMAMRVCEMFKSHKLT